MVEGQDPHRVPQRDLFRRGRDRDRGGSAHLLRLGASRLRPGRRRALCLAAPAVGGRAPGRDDLLAERLLPASQPRGGSGAAQPRAPADDRGGLSDRRGVREVRGARASRRGRHRAAAGELARAVLHLVAATAARRSLRRRRGLRRRPRDHVDPRPRAPERGPVDRRGPARRHRADGVRRCARQRHRRGARDGRRAELPGGTLQPRHQRPPPARLGVQAVHADHRPRTGPLDRGGLRLGPAGDPVPGAIREQEGQDGNRQTSCSR